MCIQIGLTNNNPSKTPLIDLLRRIPRETWVEIIEPSGWSYHTNIGNLLHEAADEIDRLQNNNQYKPMDVVSMKQSNGSWVNRTFRVVEIQNNGKRLRLNDHNHPVRGMRQDCFGAGAEDCKLVTRPNRVWSRLALFVGKIRGRW